MFTLTVERDTEAEGAAEGDYLAFSLLLLPKARALWESWVESGLLTIEDGEGGPRWRINGAQEGMGVGDEGGK
jgi:hypothetical protein